MGFLDKAKKLADQAQARIDETQQQFNARQAGTVAAGPVVEYDQHGRPIRRESSFAPPGAPAAGPPASPAEPSVPPAEPSVPPAAPSVPPGAPAAPAGELRDAQREGHEPPPLTSGDPLRGPTPGAG